MRPGTTSLGAAARLAALALSSAVAVAAGSTPCRGADGAVALPDERLGIRTAPLLLLSRPDVRDDLGLSPEQAAEAERAITELYIRASAARGKTGPEGVEARKLIDEAQQNWVATHLSPEQAKRLVQVDLQWEGPSALVSRPMVAGSLGLTAEQRAAVKQAVAHRDKARAEGRYTKADEAELFNTALSVLTPTQRTRWRAMNGREFLPRLASGPPPTRR
jgi:hypothetical protein